MVEAPSEEITIGVIGGEDMVQRAVQVARTSGSPSWRLVVAVNAEESDAYAHAVKIAPRVDVCVFAGPLPYDIAVSRGDLPVPATFVPVGGASLYSALLRAQLENHFDLEHITIDSASVDDVRSAYREVGLNPADVHVEPYVGTESAQSFMEFHRQHFENGHTSGAMTTVPTVAGLLSEAGIPSMFMRATPTTLLHSLHTAALIGSGARLEESRIATVVVRIPRSVVPEHTGLSNYWWSELKLSLHRELLREARAMDAAVLSRDDRSFLVLTTMGSLATVTDDLTIAPFLGQASADLDIPLEVGVGLGRSTREAEFNAEVAVDKSAAAESPIAFLVGPRETVLQLPGDHSRGQSLQLASLNRDPKAIDTLRRLAAAVDSGEDAGTTVDAAMVADVLGTTLRTARRTLKLLVDQGLAWQLPPLRQSKAGRPARLYQLLVEKLPPAE